METQHQAAIDLLQCCAKHPKTPLKIDEISSEIFQSRTSLFQRSKEHFQRTPLELQRFLRLDRVRQLLINPKQRHKQGLNGTSKVLEEMGFSSRSHFAHRYQQHFDELPHETLHPSRGNTLQNNSHEARPELEH